MKDYKVPNRLKSRPTFSFNSDGLTPEVINFLNNQKKIGKCSEYISEAINFKYKYDFFLKGFIIELIERNFGLVKHILRQIGSVRGKFEKS